MLIGKPRKDDPSGHDEAEDISGIACASGTGFPRVCLIADDESQGAQIVLLHENGTFTGGAFIPLITDSFNNKAPELDAEAVAFADGAFYVIGSHGRPRHEDDPAKRAKADAKAAATRRLFRIRLPAGGVNLQTGTPNGAVDITEADGLWTLINADVVLRESADRPLSDNGLTVEGLAALNGQLHVGLRAPVIDGAAFVFSVPPPVLFDGAPAQATLHPLALGADTRGAPRGIRDLVAYDGRFLVLAGPSKDPPDGKIARGDYTILAWPGHGPARRLLDLDGFGDKTKPEALLPMDERDGVLRALLLFDGPRAGLPTPVDIPWP